MNPHIAIAAFLLALLQLAFFAWTMIAIRNLQDHIDDKLDEKDDDKP